MVFLRIAEFIAFILFLYASIVQIVIPLWNGTKLFPFFRTKESKLRSELVDVRQEETEAVLSQKVLKEKEKLSRFRQDNAGN